MKVDIKNMSLGELETFVAGMGKEKYRVAQIFKWLYQYKVDDFDEMSNLSRSFREELKELAYISSIRLEKEENSSDGTSKYLYELSDGEGIESVLIRDGSRRTLCISSQVGCPLDCAFCLTGSIGFKRNLETSEIINQILCLMKSLDEGEKITNIVFMGMGEPLLNYENVVRAIGIITCDQGLGISIRKVTLSTAGVVPQIVRLGQDTNINLAVSLNATTDEVRQKIMPVDKKYSLESLLAACRAYPLPPRRKITFEYVMLKGINDSPEDAKRLVALLRGIPSMVNLLPFNEYEGASFKRPSKERIDSFHKYLLDKGMTVITRSGKGDDISAACGQLRGRLKR
ncbi:MAG: 23S rRNA (adenine(2503)-C(2))-methyltransferase RlmN [bacterium]|nr:23S rRNA (adenine(2503)-C(2))-methyltransferase RlmN [bacterium]